MIQVSQMDKTILKTTYYVVSILIKLYLLKLFHFNCYPIRWIFSTSPSLVDSTGETAYHYNFMIYFSFFIVHYVMALMVFKNNMKAIFPKYPLYQRMIYNFISVISYHLLLEFARPVAN